MADPTLKRTSVTIKYTASDGYRHEVSYSNIGRMGTKPPPEVPLLEAIDELARLCELFGFGAKASLAVATAQMRVREWRAHLATDTPKGNEGQA